MPMSAPYSVHTAAPEEGGGMTETATLGIVGIHHEEKLQRYRFTWESKYKRVFLSGILN